MHEFAREYLVDVETLAAYQRWTASHAGYETHDCTTQQNILFVGTIEEVFEVNERLENRPDDLYGLEGELGDVMYYISEKARKAGFIFPRSDEAPSTFGDQIADTEDYISSTFDFTEPLTIFSTRPTDVSQLQNAIVGLLLASNANYDSSLFKEHGEPYDTEEAVLRAIWAVIQVARNKGLTLEEIIRHNISKIELRSRENGILNNLNTDKHTV